MKIVLNAKAAFRIVNLKEGATLDDFRTMPDGTIAFGPQIILDAFEDVIQKQIDLDANSKFKPEECIKVTADFEDLVNYYVSSGETVYEAKEHALKIIGKEGYNIGTIIHATKCDEGMFYTLELPMLIMEFLPEVFIEKI